MAKKQTRRSISLRAEKFVRLERLAEKLGHNPTRLVELLVDAASEVHSVADVARDEALRCLGAKAKPEPAMPDHGAHFTF